MREFFRTLFGVGGTLLILGSIGGLEHDYMDMIKFIAYATLGLVLVYISVAVPEYKKPAIKQAPVKKIYNWADEK